MADLNPLKFAVAIQDEATAQLGKIEKEFDKLKDKTISVKVDGIQDLQNLLSALQHKQVETLGKDVAAGIHDAAKGLQEEAQKAVRASLGQLAQDLVAVKTAIQHDNFTAFGNRIETCAEKVNLLTKAFQEFQVTIGKDDGMRNFMTGLGEVVRNVGTTMRQLHVNNPAYDVTPDAMVRSVNVAKHEVERLENTLVKAARTVETFGEKGFNVSSLERYKAGIIEIRDNLKQIRDNGGTHPVSGLTASQYLSSEDSNRAVSLMKTELGYYEKIGRELERIAQLKSTLSSVLSANPGTSYRGDITNAIAGLDLREGLFARMGVRDSLQMLGDKDYRAQTAEAVGLISKVSAESRQAEKDNAHLVESMRRAGIAVSDLAAKFDKLEIAKIRANAVDAKVDTSAYDRAVERMERYQGVLAYIADKGGHDATRITGSVGYRNASNDLNVQAAALKTLTADANKAASAAQQLSAEEQRLAQAMMQSTNAAMGQSQVLSDLKSMAMQYLSVWGAQQVLNNIIEIGGQLEMQRLSIGAILGDAAKANELFGQVKALAIKSPFGVVELDQDMKQLSAYGFEAHELFDMTRRLADMSAATGTDVSRLALALGHVRSEMALTGYTLRQFSMANVPLAKMLAEQLSEVEKRAVSVAEVRKRVSKKEIGYEEVEKVIKDLTNEGGMFYNMQEVMSESVKAKFKNLKDSMDIMYGEIAESSVGGALKKVAEMLMGLTRNWEDMIAVLGVAATMYVAQRGRTMLLNEAIRQQVLSTRNATLVNSKYTISQLRVIAAMRQSTGVGKGMAVMFTSIKAGAIAAGRAIQALWSSLWPMLAVSAGVEMWMHWKEQSEQAGEAARRAFDKASEGVKHAKEAFESLPFYSDEMDSGELRRGIESAATTLKNYNEVMANDILANVNRTDKDGHSVMSLAEQYKYLRGEVEKTKDMMEEYKRTSSAMGDAVAATGGFLNDNVYKDLNQYAASYKNLQRNLNNFYASNRRAVEEAVDKAIEADATYAKLTRNMEGYGERLMVLFKDRMVIDSSRKLKDADNIFKEAFVSAGGNLYDQPTIGETAGRLEEAKVELNKWAVAYKRTMEGSFGYNFSNLTEVQFANVRQQIWDFSNSEELSNLDEIGKKWVRDYLGRLFNITFSVESEQALREVDEIKERLDDLVGGDWKIDIKGATNIDDVISKIQKGYKAAKDWLDSAQPMLLKIGITSVDGAELWSDDYIRQMAKGDPIWEQSLKKTREEAMIKKQAENANKEYGIPLGDKNKKGSKEDKNAKEIREKVKVMKEAADAFQYWRDKVGDEAAWQHVVDEFGDVLRVVGVTADNIKDLKGNLLGVLNDPKYKAIKDKKTRDDIHKDISKDVAQIERKDFEKSAEEFASKVQIELEELTRAWEIFNSVREATGDVELGVKIAGLEGLGGETAKHTTLADALRKKIEGEMDKIGGQGAHLFLDFNVRLSDKEIEDEVQRAFKDLAPVKPENADKSAQESYQERLKSYESHIKGIVSEYKKWRDLQRDLLKSDIGQYKELIGGLVDEQSRLTKAQTEYSDTLLSLKRLRALGVAGKQGGISELEYDQAVALAGLRLEDVVMKSSADYQALMSGIVTMNKTTARRLKEDYVGLLQRQLRAGVITAKDYADGISEINQKMQELENAPSYFQSYMQSGLNGIFEKMQSEGKSKVMQGAQMQQEGRQMYQEGMKSGNMSQWMQGWDVEEAGTQMSQIGEGLQEMGGDMAQTIAIIDLIIHAINDLVQGMKNTYDEIKEMYEALGHDTDSGEWSSAGTFFSSFSNASTSATKGWESLKSGNLGGVIEGVVGSWTNWITGFAKGYDAKRDHEIELAKEQLAVLKNMDSHISTLNERSLGYGSSDAKTVNKLRTLYDKTERTGVYDTSERAISSLREGFLGSLIGGAIGSIGGPLGAALGGIIGGVRGNVKGAKQDYITKKYYSEDTLSALSEALSSGSTYSAEYASLLAQRDDTNRKLEAARGKKDSSDSEIEEYESELDALEDKIANFAEDLAKELWGIDIKGWADQIGDALMTAFENGENAMDAFDEAAKNIMQNVVSEILKVGIIEPMMDELRDTLFGKVDENGNRSGGVVSTQELKDSPKTAATKMVNALGDFFKPGGNGSNLVIASEEYLEGVNSLLRQYGYSNGLRNDNTNTLSSSIQGTSEETSGLLAGYVNALRQDVAEHRLLFSQFITDLWPKYAEEYGRQVRAVARIDVNVQGMYDMMQYGSGAMYEELNKLRSRIDSVVNGVDSLKIR